MPRMHVVLEAVLLLASSVARQSFAAGGAIALDTSSSASISTLTRASTLTLTPITTITKPLSTSSPAASLINGRCIWRSRSESWICDRNGFVCEGSVTGRQNDHHGVCVDRRTPGQKEADKHEVADGKNGGCAYSYDTQGYYCAQRGFVCRDEMACADRRTAEEKAEDKAIEALEEALRQESQRRHKRMNAIVGGITGGLIGVMIRVGTLCWVWRCWRRKRREGKPAREQTRRDRERGMELAKLESTRAKKEGGESESRL